MAKKKNSDWSIGVLVVVVGTGILYYVGTGIGKANDSAILPNTLEDQIDLLIERLNKRFGQDWVVFGLQALTHFVYVNLPSRLVNLVDVVVAIENESKHRPITSKEKQEMAIRMVHGY